MNRRQFIGSSIALAGFASRAPLFARAEEAALSLPASIAALTSMRDQVKPITNDERRARIEKATRLMAENRIAALVLTPGTSLAYFTNIHWSGGERLFACVIPAKGEPFFVCPAFEEDRAREQIALGPFGSGRADVRTWQEDESPYNLLARGLHDRGVSSGPVGIEENATVCQFIPSVARDLLTNRRGRTFGSANGGSRRLDSRSLATLGIEEVTSPAALPIRGTTPLSRTSCRP